MQPCTWPISYGIRYSKVTRFSSSIYAFHLDTGEVIRFSDGFSPSLAAQKERVIVHDGTLLSLLDSSGHEDARFDIPRLGYRGVTVSPDGELVLVEMQRHSPFFPGGTLTLVDVARPDTRHVIDDGFSYKYDWAESVQDPSDQASEITAPPLNESLR
jgi:hypothetical protein